MKKVSHIESVSKFSIDLKVKNRNIIIEMIINIKIAVVFGLLSKLKNGPMIVKINPNVDEIKNLGNRNTLSQKSDILNNYKAVHYLILIVLVQIMT
jgi:hypothetical protein